MKEKKEEGKKIEKEIEGLWIVFTFTCYFNNRYIKVKKKLEECLKEKQLHANCLSIKRDSKCKQVCLALDTVWYWSGKQRKANQFICKMSKQHFAKRNEKANKVRGKNVVHISKLNLG